MGSDFWFLVYNGHLGHFVANYASGIPSGDARPTSAVSQTYSFFQL